MIDSTETLYTRGTKLKPFDPEENAFSTTGEAIANSIVNVKKLVVNFNLGKFMNVKTEGNTRCGSDSECRKEIVNYIETAVIPYLTQMIPSTSILETTYTFGDEVSVPVTGTFEQIDNS